MSKKESLIRDTESRKKIITEIDKNFFVEAGAGSGKTTMLVNRMVAMVENGKPIDKMCAITFTKAAAGEFYERFQKLLIERSSTDCKWEQKSFAGQLPKPTEDSSDKCKDALEKIDLCFMGTIDAFCAMVMSEHPSEAGVSSDAVLVSDEEAGEFYRKQFIKICKGAYGEELKEAAAVFNSIHDNADELFGSSMVFFMNNRNVRFVFDKPKVSDIDKAFADEREKLTFMLDILLEHKEFKYDREGKSREAWDNLENTRKVLGKRWSEKFSNVIKRIKKLNDIRLLPAALERYGVTLSEYFEPGGKSGKYLECMMGKSGGLIERMISFRYKSSMSFLTACAEPIEKAMREKSYMTYFDYLYYLRNMLREDTEKEGKLISHIYNRHSFFLIDEFQDTNPLQAEIFFYLTSKKPVSKWSDCCPRQGSLFIVGDPKQSIYRFRGADVASFLRVKELFDKKGGEVLSLAINFRSAKRLCGFFNTVFTSMLHKETPEQSRFEEIPLLAQEDTEFSGIYRYKAYTEKDMCKEHPDEADHVQIAKIIESLVDNDKYMIRAGDDGEPRTLRYSDIMVITSNKDELGSVCFSLNERDIPAKVEGQVAFGTNEALAEISKLYSAVADENDETALYGALTGKLIGFTNEDILLFKSNGGRLRLSFTFEEKGCDDKVSCLVAEKIKELKVLRKESLRLSPAALFQKIMDDYRVYEYVSAENMEVLYYTLELLREAERSGEAATVNKASGYIKDLLLGASKEERCLSLKHEHDAVLLANLHKVKGLEAPVVILSAHKNFPDAVYNRIVHGENGAEGYVFAHVLKNNYGKLIKIFETGEFADEENAEREAKEAEQKRLIYVAATRARNALIISDSIGSVSKEGEEKRESVWDDLMKAEELPDFFASVKEKAKIVKPEKEELKASILYDEAEEHCVLKGREAIEKASFSAVNPSRLPIVSKLSERDETVVDMQRQEAEDENKDSKGRILPALLGTMVHKLMEMLVSAGEKAEVSHLADEIIKEYLTPETEPHMKELKKALSDVAETMKSGGYPQENKAPRDILKILREADEVCCEVPFSYMEEADNKKLLWNGIMDVIYLKDGMWHIIDYKTNADGTGLDTKYRAQLSAYVKAFKETTGEEADALTYHIDV